MMLHLLLVLFFVDKYFWPVFHYLFSFACKFRHPWVIQSIGNNSSVSDVSAPSRRVHQVQVTVVTSEPS